MRRKAPRDAGFSTGRFWGPACTPIPSRTGMGRPGSPRARGPTEDDSPAPAVPHAYVRRAVRPCMRNGVVIAWEEYPGDKFWAKPAIAADARSPSLTLQGGGCRPAGTTGGGRQAPAFAAPHPPRFAWSPLAPLTRGRDGGDCGQRSAGDEARAPSLPGDWSVGRWVGVLRMSCRSASPRVGARARRADEGEAAGSERASPPPRPSPRERGEGAVRRTWPHRAPGTRPHPPPCGEGWGGGSEEA